MLNKMDIGSLGVANVLPAPLSGYTDFPYRQILKKCGADLISTEMVSVESIVRNNPKSKTLLYFEEIERPIQIQLFGYEPDSFSKAVEILLNTNIKPDIIDINFGCSVRKILKSKSGSYLLNEPDRIGNIVKSIKKVTDIPVTAKIRSGWNNDSINYLLVGHILESSGCAAVTLHPRTTKDLFKNTARWEYIKELKKSLRIPVIGNGDIKNEEDAKRMIYKTDCDGVMIGRALMGNPFIIKNIICYLQTGKKIKIKLTELFDAIRMHFRYFINFYGINKVSAFRKHLFKYLKGYSLNKNIKKHLLEVNTIEELNKVLLLINGN